MRNIKKTVGVIVCGMLIFVLAGCSIFRDFDARGYTQAVLDQMFQGEVDDLAEFKEETGKKELSDAYKDYIFAFSQSLTEGLNVSDAMADKFYTLCREIFRTQKYSVSSVEKVSRDEYKVTVEIQPTDIFIKWKPMLVESMEGIQAKIERGEYQGTEDEILEQMMFDIAAQSYELLETAYQEMGYGEKETVVLTVKQDENEEFGIKDEEISDLVTKILRLDAIQD